MWNVIIKPHRDTRGTNGFANVSTLRKAVYDTYTVTALALVAALYYRETIVEYVRTLEIPAYSYLVVLVPVTLVVLSELISTKHVPGKLDVFTLISALGGVMVALSLLEMADVLVEYSLQLESLSMIILAGFVILLVYGEFDDAKIPLAVWILLLTLVPLPRMWIDYIASQFSHPIASIAASIAGGRLVESQGYIYILTHDPSGALRRFYVTPECSGVVSFLSVVSLTPAVAYIVSRSNSSPRRKALTLILSLFIGALIALTGNLLRITLVLYITKHHSYETAMEFFHQTPSIIYASIAALATIYLPLKLTPPSRNKTTNHQSRLGKIEGGDIAKIIAVIGLAGIFIYLGATLLPGAHAAGYNPVNAETLIKTPEEIVFNTTRLNITYHSQPRPLIGEALGALTVHSLTLKINRNYMSGWIEVAETPGRFHSWIVCLNAQGYRIEKWWSETENGTTINYAVIRKGMQRMLLAYTVLKYQTTMGNLYVKISLFTPITPDNYQEKAEKLTNIILALSETHHIPTSTTSFIPLLYTGLTIILASSITGITYKAYRKQPS